MVLIRKLKTGAGIFGKHGLRGLIGRFKSIRIRRREEIAYRRWFAANSLDDAQREAIRREIASFRRRPLISILLPVYDIEEKWLRLCIDSVRKQIYGDWELCVADDHSPSPHVARVISEYSEIDARVRPVFRKSNGHISAASNSALEIATGEFCVLLDHDDELAENALFQVAKTILERAGVAMIYSDEDVIDENGVHQSPKFKPDFSRDFLYSLNMVTHLSAYRTDILQAVGGFRKGFEGSQDYDLALRFVEQIDESQIVHIPKILYHWRAIAGSVALSGDEKPYAHDRARAALREHFERTGRSVVVERGIFQFHRVNYPLPDPSRISLIRWSPASIRVTVLDGLSSGKLPEVLDFAGSTIADRLNRAAAIAAGDVLVFCEATVEEYATDSFLRLAAFALSDGIGVAGGRVTDDHGLVVEAGLIIGGRELVRSAHRGLSNGDPGRFFRLCVENNFSAVSAVCLAVEKRLFVDLEGFEAAEYPASLFDVDFCLRVLKAGERVVFTPAADFRVAGSGIWNREITEAEESSFRVRWKSFVEKDPFYNPNLSPRGEPFKIF